MPSMFSLFTCVTFASWGYSLSNCFIINRILKIYIYNKHLSVKAAKYNTAKTKLSEILVSIWTLNNYWFKDVFSGANVSCTSSISHST